MWHFSSTFLLHTFLFFIITYVLRRNHFFIANLAKLYEPLLAYINVMFEISADLKGSARCEAPISSLYEPLVGDRISGWAWRAGFVQAGWFAARTAHVTSIRTATVFIAAISSWASALIPKMPRMWWKEIYIPVASPVSRSGCLEPAQLLFVEKGGTLVGPAPFALVAIPSLSTPLRTSCARRSLTRRLSSMTYYYWGLIGVIWMPCWCIGRIAALAPRRGTRAVVEALTGHVPTPRCLRALSSNPWRGSVIGPWFFGWTTLAVDLLLASYPVLVTVGVNILLTWI